MSFTAGLPEEAKEASRATATKCEEYLGGVGLVGEVHKSMDVLLRDEPQDCDFDRFFIGAMQTNASARGILGADAQARGNVKLPTLRNKSPFSIGPDNKSGLRGEMARHYEGRLRDVVRTFG